MKTKVVILLIFFSFEGFPILVLVKVLLQMLVRRNNYFCKIVLPVSGFFLVFLYYFDCVGPMLPMHILILDGPTMYKGDIALTPSLRDIKRD